LAHNILTYSLPCLLILPVVLRRLACHTWLYSKILSQDKIFLLQNLYWAVFLLDLFMAHWLSCLRLQICHLT